MVNLVSSFSCEGLGNLEGDSVVVKGEVGWVLSHEDITDDEIVEASWEVHGLDTENAFGLSELGDLENVVSGSQWVSGTVNGESDLWEGGKVGAILLDSDTSDELVNDGLWSNKEGSS